MKTVIMVTLVSLFSAQLTFAGDNGGGDLSCISSSGRTKLNGMAGVSYNGYGRANVEFDIDGKKIELGADKRITPYAVAMTDAVAFNENFKIYTLTFVSIAKVPDYGIDHEDVLSLISDTSTFKQTRKDVFSFEAQLTAIDPRAENKSEGLITKTKDIKVKCILDLTL